MSTIAHSLRDYRSPTRSQLFAQFFNLPNTESAIDELPAILSLSNPGTSPENEEDQVYAGRLTLTQRFLTFASIDRRSCRMSLPLYCVRRVERLNAQRTAVFALGIVVWHGMKIVSNFPFNPLFLSSVHLCSTSMSLYLPRLSN